MDLILASRSPRRSELLKNAGFQFDVRPTEVDESPLRGESAEDCARRLAREKALAVARDCDAGCLVLGADTVVSLEGELFGKPMGPFDATRMLRALSSRTHSVITAICLVRPPDRVEAWAHEATFVAFRELAEEEIRAYVASGEPFDKAGGYAIQGLASRFVTRIEGCFFNVVGLPVPLLYEILKNIPETSPPASGSQPSLTG